MELPNQHKARCKSNWKRIGIDMDYFDEIYELVISTTHCDCCNKLFTKLNDRQLDHDHNEGNARNVLCRSCNKRRKDNKLQSNNVSGYKGIHKHMTDKCLQGFEWRFQATVEGKKQDIKSCIHKPKLIAFAEKWKEDNNYET